jgi:DHA1 family tetracycline resistance protein-like MFS transporter
MIDPKTASATPGAPRRAAVIFIFITVFLDMLAFGLLIPVLPLLISDMAGGDPEHQSHVYGWFMFVWAAFQFIASPILGALSDRFGRRPVILLSNFALAVQYVILAFAPNLAVMFAARVISGVASASVSTANAYIADVTAPDKRAAAFGMLGAAFGAGFIVGPAMGGILASYDMHLPLFVAAGMSLLNGLYGLFILPESLSKDRRSKFELKKANPVASLRFLSARPDLGGLASMHFLTQLAHLVFPAVFVLYAAHRFEWGSKSIGLFMASVGVMAIIVQAGLTGRVVKALGERRALLLGLTSGAIGFALYGIAFAVPMMFAAAVVNAFWGFAGPASQSLMTQKVLPTEQGKLQGALQALTSIGGLIGPLLYTYVFGFFISDNAPAHAPGAPFILAAVLLCGAIMFAFTATRPSISAQPRVQETAPLD